MSKAYHHGYITEQWQTMHQTVPYQLPARVKLQKFHPGAECIFQSRYAYRGKEK